MIGLNPSYLKHNYKIDLLYYNYILLLIQNGSFLIFDTTFFEFDKHLFFKYSYSSALSYTYESCSAIKEPFQFYND